MRNKLKYGKKKNGILKKVIILSLISASAAVTAVIVYKQRNNIIALNYAVNYSAEGREKLQDENDKLIADIIDSLSDEGVSLLTEEEITRFKSGDLSEEQVLEIIEERKIINDNISKGTSNAVNTNDEKEDNNTTPDSSDNIGDLTAQIYSLRSSFSGKVDSIVAQAQSDAASGQYTKSELISKYAGQLSSLEKSCDAQFDSIVSQIEEELKQTGGNTDVVSDLRKAYQNEKSIKKASILSKYTGR